MPAAPCFVRFVCFVAYVTSQARFASSSPRSSSLLHTTSVIATPSPHAPPPHASSRFKHKSIINMRAGTVVGSGREQTANPANHSAARQPAILRSARKSEKHATKLQSSSLSMGPDTQWKTGQWPHPSPFWVTVSPYLRLQSYTANYWKPNLIDITFDGSHCNIFKKENGKLSIQSG